MQWERERERERERETDLKEASVSLAAGASNKHDVPLSSSHLTRYQKQNLTVGWYHEGKYGEVVKLAKEEETDTARVKVF